MTEESAGVDDAHAMVALDDAYGAAKALKLIQQEIVRMKYPHDHPAANAFTPEQRTQRIVILTITEKLLRAKRDQLISNFLDHWTRYMAG